MRPAKLIGGALSAVQSHLRRIALNHAAAGRAGARCTRACIQTGSRPVKTTRLRADARSTMTNPMETQTLPDATTLRRLAFAKFLYRLGVEQSRKPEPLSSVAVLSFHDGVEFFLQLASEARDAPTKSGITFMEYWEILAPKVEGGISQKAAMQRLNKARGNLKHAGTFLSALDVEAFRDSTARFFAENTPRVFGLDSAEVSLVDLVMNGAVRDDLHRSQADLAASNPEGAVSHAAIAFRRLLDDYDESLRDPRGGRTPFLFGRDLTFLSSFHMGLGRDWSGGRPDQTEQKLAKFVDSINATVEEIRDALKFVSLGLDYRRLTRFQILTPEAYRTINDPTYQTNDLEGGISEEDVEFCIDFVIESALVLQDFSVAVRSTELQALPSQ
jgi:hypothetical protein